MGLGSEVAIPIDGNHRTICRFSGPEELRFQPVITNLKAIINDVRPGRNNSVRDKSAIFIQLERPDVKQHKSRNPHPVPGTCKWLLDHLVYRDWLNQKESYLLWISADPGCGKSVIASYLIDKKLGLEQHPRVNICYFFFKSDNSEQQSAVKGLQSLIVQLVEQQPTLKILAANAFEGRSTEKLDDLWEVLVEVAKQPRVSDPAGSHSTFCIVDGLDECDEADRRKLTRLMAKTFEKTLAAQNTQVDEPQEVPFKVLVLSRPDKNIKISLDKAAFISPGQPSNCARVAMIRLRGEDETDAISADVEAVICSSISDLIEQGLPHDLLLEVQEQLIMRADRTFLWATLILQLLAEKVEIGASRRELNSILDNRSIDTIYAELLALRPDVAKTRKMLSILLAAIRPLTVTQMSIALAIRPDYDIFSEGKHPHRPSGRTLKDLEDDMVYPFETHLKFICGNFVRIIQNKVYLIHETAREFLLESGIQNNAPQYRGSESLNWDELLFSSAVDDMKEDIHQPVARPGTPQANHISSQQRPVCSPWQYSFSLVESNAIVLQICTTFLYMMGKKCDIALLGQPSKATAEFFEYAAQSWGRHFTKARQNIASMDLRYYENLCHPAFPGFDSWTKAVFGTYMLNIAVGRSVDQIQDYITGLLGIVPGDPENDTASQLGKIPDIDQDPEEPEKAFAIEALARFSTNPMSQKNSYFPIEVDNDGFVGIDHSGKTTSEGLHEEGKPGLYFTKKKVGFTISPGEYEAWLKADMAARTASKATRGPRSQSSGIETEYLGNDGMRYSGRQ